MSCLVRRRFGHEFVIIGDKSLLKGALSNEEDVGFTLPVLTANEIIRPDNMSEYTRHKVFRRQMAQVGAERSDTLPHPSFYHLSLFFPPGFLMTGL